MLFMKLKKLSNLKKVARKAVIALKRISHSPLFWLLLDVITYFFSPLIALLGLVAYFLHLHRKTVKHETALLTNLFLNAVQGEKWAWWNQINEDVVLGALPLKSKGHIEELIEQEKIGAVLTMVEPFELHRPALFHEAVTAEDWAAYGIVHKEMPVVDVTSPAPERIKSAVAFIQEQIDQGRRVYVHCKAGIGRSAVIVICYLLKSGHFLSADEAIKHVIALRSQACFLEEHQKQAVRDFHKHHCKNSP
jgi:protein-tyrosine phosphatase